MKYGKLTSSLMMTFLMIGILSHASCKTLGLEEPCKSYEVGMTFYNQVEYAKAKALFEHAVMEGNTTQLSLLADLRAIKMLGEMHKLGQGTPIDPVKSQYYFDIDNDPTSMKEVRQQLELIKESKVFLAEQKWEEGLKLFNSSDFRREKACFMESAGMDFAYAHFWIGVCIHFGFCRNEQDHKKISTEYYQIAANKGVLLVIDMVEAIKTIDGFKEYIRNKK